MPRTPKEQTVYRFGVSIEPALLNEFDAFVREAGFANRSEAIRELIRARLIGSESEFAEGDVAAILSVFYSSQYSGVLERLGALRREFSGMLLGVMDIPLKDNSCLQIVGLMGGRKAIRAIRERCGSIQGIQHVSATIVPLEYLRKHFYVSTSVPLHTANPLHRYFDEVAHSREPVDVNGLKLALARFDMTNKTVMDAGCGSGNSTAILLDMVRQSGRVVGVDFSERALNEARKRFGARVEFRHEDLLECSLPAASIDCVVCHDTFSALLDQPAFFRLFRRILRPGGFILIFEGADGATPSNSPIVRRLPPRSEMVRMANSAAFNVSLIEEGESFLMVADTVSSANSSVMSSKV